MKKKLISIVTPVFNEEETIRQYYAKICEVTNQLSSNYDFEIIITDNCSSDNTVKIISEIAKKDPRIFLYKLSRNFGHQRSVWTGYLKCRGDAAIEIDADLQDPPEMLPEMLHLWEKGNKIVYGIRTDRKENAILTLCKKIFYRLVKVMSETEIPNDAGDFMVIDRDIINHLTDLKVQDPYLRGTIFSFGYTRRGIEYTREVRKVGTSKFPLSKLVVFAINAIINTSNFPLKISTFIGFFSAFCAFLLACYFIVDKLLLGAELPRGITALLVLLLMSIAINSILIGIVGEYVGKIYKQLTLQDKVTIVESEINFSNLKKDE